LTFVQWQLKFRHWKTSGFRNVNFGPKRLKGNIPGNTIKPISRVAPGVATPRLRMSPDSGRGWADWKGDIMAKKPKPAERHGEPPVVRIPPDKYAELSSAHAEMVQWADAGNTVAKGWVWPSTPAKAEVNLSPAEQDIVDVIREAGGKIDSQSKILDALNVKEKIPSEGTTKVLLAAMVRHGILKTGPGGKGYSLP
jgi:hypothetical protein